MWERLPRVDPLGALLGGASLVVFLLHGFEGRLTRDVAVYAYAGQQVAEGVAPYDNVLNRAGPIAHLVPGAGAFVGRVIGSDDLLAMRVTMMLVSVLAVWAAYLLGRDVYRSRAAGAVCAASLLSFQGFITYATDGPREKTTMVLVVLVALTALARRGWATAGVATALATLTWQGSFFPLAAAALLAGALLPASDSRSRALGRWAGAGLVVATVTVGCFAAAGALRQFWEGFVLVNAGWTEQRGLVSTVTETGRVSSGFGWTAWLLVLGLAGSLVVAGLGLRRLDRASAGDVAALASAAGVVVCILWALKSFEGWPDAFVALPFAALGVAGVAHLVLARLPEPARMPSVAVLVTTALVVAAGWATADRNSELDDQRRHLAAVLAPLGGQADLLAVGNPVPLVLSGSRNPIRYQLFSGGQGAYLQETYPGGLAGLAREIEDLQPTLLTRFGASSSQWLREVLQRDYERIGGTRRSFVWFASTTRTTAEERAAMRRADRRFRRHDRGTGPRASFPDVQLSLP